MFIVCSFDWQLHLSQKLSLTQFHHWKSYCGSSKVAMIRICSEREDPWILRCCYLIEDMVFMSAPITCIVGWNADWHVWPDTQQANCKWTFGTFATSSLPWHFFFFLFASWLKSKRVSHRVPHDAKRNTRLPQYQQGLRLKNPPPADLNCRLAFQHLISSCIYGSMTQTASPRFYFTSLRYLKLHASDCRHTQAIK